MRFSNVVLFFFCVISMMTTHAATLPVEYFAQLPDVAEIDLSPKGQKLASKIRIAVGDTLGTGIQVTNLKTSASKVVLFSDNSKYFLGDMYWKDEVTLLVQTWYPAKRDTWTGMSRVHGDTREVRLLIVDTEKDTVQPPFKPLFLKKYKYLPSGLGTVIDTLPDDSKHILMSIPGMSDGWPISPIVVQVNIKNRSSKTLQESETSTFGWETDKQHNIRAALKAYDDGTYEYLFRNKASNKWEPYWPHKIFTDSDTYFLGYDYNPDYVYILSYINGYKALSKVDIRDPELKKEIIIHKPGIDITGSLVFGRKSKKLLGVNRGKDLPVIFIAPEWQAIQEKIDNALPDMHNHIYAITDDESQFLVYSNNPTNSGTYYLGTRDPLKLTTAAYSYKNLPSSALSEVKPMTYEARDGLEISAYLTLPRGSNGKNLPTILFPHGGPLSADTWTFDYWAQFFASRGYAVLQMNFRGSVGQGLAFRQAGLKQWGKQMQDDIEDGALALIEQGIADKNRLCIVGASYGGYAALMGVVKTPDRYRCSISVNGVSDLIKLVRANRSVFASYNIVDEQIGKERSELKDNSPVNNVDRITVPVLLIHGENDRQVDIEHSVDMSVAMERAHKNVEFIRLEAEDHYLSNEVNRMKTFKAMAAFLDKYLPVNTQK